MKKYFVLLVVMFLGACVENTTAPLMSDDYVLVAFGPEGMALEGTLGEQSQHRPFDGRTGTRPLPEELKLTPEQHATIKALRDAFREANAERLDALKVVFQRARTAREGGATQEQIRAILAEARPLLDAIRPSLRQLHLDILAVYTTEQKMWIMSHRRVRP